MSWHFFTLESGNLCIGICDLHSGPLQRFLRDRDPLGVCREKKDKGIILDRFILTLKTWFSGPSQRDSWLCREKGRQEYRIQNKVFAFGSTGIYHMTFWYHAIFNRVNSWDSSYLQIAKTKLRSWYGRWTITFHLSAFQLPITPCTFILI